MKFFLVSCLVAGACARGFGGFGSSEEQGGFGGGRGGKVPLQNPFPFLKEVNNQSCVQSFFATAYSKNLTLTQIETELTSWASSCGVSTQYQEFVTKMQAFEDELKQNITTLATDLPNVLQQIETIVSNKDQTAEQLEEAIKEFINTTLAKEPAQMGPVLLAVFGLGGIGGRQGGHGMGRGGFGGQGHGHFGGQQGGFGNQNGGFGGQQGGFQNGGQGSFGGQGRGSFGGQGQGQGQQIFGQQGNNGFGF
ncbi:unnamed protein product, partial [Mesorhabditis spiculigera]